MNILKTEIEGKTYLLEAVEVIEKRYLKGDRNPCRNCFMFTKDIKKDNPKNCFKHVPDCMKQQRKDKNSIIIYKQRDSMPHLVTLDKEECSEHYDFGFGDEITIDYRKFEAERKMNGKTVEIEDIFGLTQFQVFQIKIRFQEEINKRDERKNRKFNR